MNTDNSSIAETLFFYSMIIGVWFMFITLKFDQIILNMSFEQTIGSKIYTDKLDSNNEKISTQYTYKAYGNNFIGEFKVEEDGYIEAPSENKFDIYYSKIFPAVSTLDDPNKEEHWSLITLIILNGGFSIYLVIIIISIIFPKRLEQSGDFFTWYILDLILILLFCSLGYLNSYLSIVSYIVIYFLLIRLPIKDISLITIVLPIVIWELIINFHTYYGKLNSVTYFYFICKSCFIATFKVIAEIIIILVKNKPEISEYKFIELLKYKIN